MKESLCWSCNRAYAKPDPAGCGWHRLKMIDGKAERESRPFGEHEVKVIETDCPTQVRSYEVVRVIGCTDYEASPKAQRDWEERKRQFAAASKVGIAAQILNGTPKRKYTDEMKEKILTMWLAGCKYETISIVLDIPRGSIGNTIRRARQKAGRLKVGE